jgi:hypothetical protein
LLAFGLLSAAVAIPTGCEPAQLPHQLPGPVGCGKRDPRDTAPGMLSVAQKTALKNMGEPWDVRSNDKGGLDWLYRRTRGSVFGQSEEVIVYQFDQQGLLFNQTTDVVERLGKG